MSLYYINCPGGNELTNPRGDAEGNILLFRSLLNAEKYKNESEVVSMIDPHYDNFDKTVVVDEVTVNNACAEIVLDKPRYCEMGYPCIACYDQVVGPMNGVCGRCMRKSSFDITIRNNKWIDEPIEFTR